MHAVYSEVLFWVVTLVQLSGVGAGVLKIVIVMWRRLSDSFVCHDTISLAQKDHPKLRGYLTPRDVQTVTLPSTLALSLWKISHLAGMRHEFPIHTSWCYASFSTLLTGEICEGSNSSWRFINFVRLLGELIVGSVYDLKLKMTTFFTASA